MNNQENKGWSKCLQVKSGKKLAGLTALISLLVICIVFVAVFYLVSYQKLKLLDQYIHEVPNIVTARENEMETRSRVFEDDMSVRGELGLRIYQEESGLSSEEERLEKVRGMIAAESVSLADDSGAILYTTGPVIPMERFEAKAASIEPGAPVFEVFSALSADGKQEDTDGKGLLKLPVETGAGSSLIFEFSCEPLLEVYRDLGDWSGILERMLSGLDAYAFIRIGDNDPIGYPLNGFTETGRELLAKRIADIFQQRGQLFSMGSGSSYKLVSVLGKAVLAVQLPYPKLDAKLLLAVPLWQFISPGVYCSAAISLFVILNLILYLLYVNRLDRRNRGKKEKEAFRREAGRAARPGRLAMLAAVICFSVMLLMLESRATLAYIGTSKRMALQDEVSWHESQKEKTFDLYSDIYRTRTQALAALLTEHKEYRTRDDLQAFCKMLRADYLMLFDNKGHETISSNSYTGFSVSGSDANVSGEYRAVLLGYPSVVVGPEKDPYTEKQQIGAAALLTQDNGQAGGFLLAVFDADRLNEALKKESLQNTVNSFALVKGHKAAVINKEDGLYLAHTDAKKIGLKAENDMAADVYGSDYAGYTEYEGQEMYVSGVSLDGKALLFMVPERTEDKEFLGFILMILLLLAVIVFLYCPKAGSLYLSAMDEAAEKSVRAEKEKPGKRNPLFVFACGDVAFLTVLAGIAWPAAHTTEWTPFTFVFSGMWSRGIHLFSLWAALFLLSVVLSAAILFRMALAVPLKRADSQTRTVLKLADSFVVYATGIILVLGILYLFGVNTAALLASAGIVSIAVGMGAKDMVSDILAGLFLAMEGSVHMGDTVTIGSWKGRVTDMGIRTTKITDDSQNVKILNNSRISDVVNMSRKKTFCVSELVLQRSVSMAETEKIVEEALKAAAAEMPELYDSLQLEGIHHISREDCTARLSYSCDETVRESVTKQLLAFIQQRVQQEMEKAAHLAANKEQ